jgi:hypothetical protein
VVELKPRHRKSADKIRISSFFSGGFSAKEIRRRIRRAESFSADIRRTKFWRLIRISAAAEGSRGQRGAKGDNMGQHRTRGDKRGQHGTTGDKGDNMDKREQHGTTVDNSGQEGTTVDNMEQQ